MAVGCELERNDGIALVQEPQKLERRARDFGLPPRDLEPVPYLSGAPGNALLAQYRLAAERRDQLGQIGSGMLAWIMATQAATLTRMVVLKPAA